MARPQRRLIICNKDGSVNTVTFYESDGNGIELGKALLMHGFVKNGVHYTHPDGLTYRSQYMHVTKPTSGKRPHAFEAYTALGMKPDLGYGAQPPFPGYHL